MNEIQSRTVKVISDYFNTKVRPSTTLAKLEADSLDQVELLMSLEAEFDIEIPDDEASSVKDVQGIIKLVEKYTS
jgi:acyl carrier protein